jgi:hypothetical protein
MARISNIVNGVLSSKPRTKIIDETVLSFSGAGSVSPSIEEAWGQAWEEEDGSYTLWLKIRSSHSMTAGPHTYGVGGAVMNPGSTPSVSVITNGTSGNVSSYISDAGKLVVEFPSSTKTIITATISLSVKPTWFDTYIESDDGISLATTQDASPVVGSPDISLSVTDGLMQKKIVYSDVKTDTSFMAFNNLTVGKVYKLHMSLTGAVNDDTADNSIRVKVVHGGAPIDILEGQSNSTQEIPLRGTIVFKASSSYLTLDTDSASEGSYVMAEDLASLIPSHVIIEECPYLVETSSF